MSDTLADITTRGWILALFIRDDGERFLLGDGAYDFKSELQHFQPNTFANDIVELQGTDGQLIAGQVRRSTTQSFDGYIGDATKNRQTIENYRRDFLMFFRKNFFYKVIYIFPNGEAIQRKRGYIVDAPSVPELYQIFPEYHVGLNFEDPDYYEYAEDEHGDEIYANIREILIAQALSGGLIWDADGAVSDPFTINYNDPVILSGNPISLTNSTDYDAPVLDFEMQGNATQNGTPTPDAPVAVNTTTGENVVKITGKNLSAISQYLGIVWGASESDYKDLLNTLSAGTYTFSAVFTITERQDTTDDSKYGIYFANSAGLNVLERPQWGAVGVGATATLTKTFTITEAQVGKFTNAYFYGCGGATGNANSGRADITNIQLELGNSASPYEAYQGQDYEVNLGKNLLNPADISQGTWINPSITNTCAFFMPVFTGEMFTISNQDTATYRFSCGLCATPHAGTNSQDSGWQTGASYTITAQSNGYLYVQLRRNDTGTITPSTIPTNTYMVERGSSATTYAPYFTPIELAKISDTNYRDRIYPNDGKWYVEKQIDKAIYDGSNDETWGIANSGTARWIYYTYLPQNNTTIGVTAMSNLGVWSNLSNGEQGIFPVSNKLLRVRLGEEQTTADWRTFLASTNMIIYYALATPTTTEITEQALIDQLEAIVSAYLPQGAVNISLTGAGAQGSMILEYHTVASIDMTGAGYEWEDGGTGGDTTISVAGVDAVQPIWEVQGPATDPTLTNITTNQTITWQSTVPAGQTLTVDMDKRTATMAGANVFQFITGDWISLEPGNNRLNYTASGGATEPATISWNGVVG